MIRQFLCWIGLHERQSGRFAVGLICRHCGKIVTRRRRVRR